MAGAPTSGGSPSSGGSTNAGVASDGYAPALEPVLGCSAQSLPDAGAFYEPFNDETLSVRHRQLLQSYSAHAISADGRVVVGQTRDPDTAGLFPISWTLSGGVAAIPVATEGPGDGIQVSCNGDIILVGDTPFEGVYRVDVPHWQYPLVIHGNLGWVSMDPTASLIVTGRGQDREIDGAIVSYPRTWTAASGPVELATLPNTVIHQAAADGTLVGSDHDELFRFYPATKTREPIGLSPVGGTESIAISSSGYAWIQNADQHYDSFLVWRQPEQPISVTCPGPCTMVDLSSTGQIALIEAANDAGDVVSSWLWTDAGGFMDLSLLMEQAGFDLRGRVLHATAMSDDGRVLTGYSTSRDLAPGDADPLFFYAVVPAAVYQTP
jgi:hypothetical protein